MNLIGKPLRRIQKKYLKTSLNYKIPSQIDYNYSLFLK